MKAEYQVGSRRIEVVQGSITRYSADALVCPTNPDLEMVAFPGGVQYAFLVEGGQEIFQEASALGERLRQMSAGTRYPMAAPPTSAHITNAGRLPARYVVHVVSVGYDEQKGKLHCDGDVIGKSTRNVLELAREKQLQSVGFPALGTGLYRVPLEEAVESMSEEFARHLKSETSIERLGLVLYTVNDYSIGKNVMDRKFSSTGNSNKETSSELKIGGMPQPRYLLERGDTTGEGIIKWIGMQAYAPDGTIKDFLWWRNFKVGDLNKPRNRYQAATFIARLKLEMDADSAIGLPIDLHRSNPQTDYIAIVEEPGLYGAYIEADKRPMFNFKTIMQGVRSEGQLRRSKPVEFDEIFQKAKTVLPYTTQ